MRIPEGESYSLVLDACAIFLSISSNQCILQSLSVFSYLLSLCVSCRNLAFMYCWQAIQVNEDAVGVFFLGGWTALSISEAGTVQLKEIWNWINCLLNLVDCKCLLQWNIVSCLSKRCKLNSLMNPISNYVSECTCVQTIWLPPPQIIPWLFSFLFKKDMARKKKKCNDVESGRPQTSLAVFLSCVYSDYGARQWIKQAGGSGLHEYNKSFVMQSVECWTSWREAWYEAHCMALGKSLLTNFPWLLWG